MQVSTSHSRRRRPWRSGRRWWRRAAARARARHGHARAVAPLLGGVVVAADLDVERAAGRCRREPIDLEAAVGERDQAARRAPRGRSAISGFRLSGAPLCHWLRAYKGSCSRLDSAPKPIFDRRFPGSNRSRRWRAARASWRGRRSAARRRRRRGRRAPWPCSRARRRDRPDPRATTRRAETRTRWPRAIRHNRNTALFVTPVDMPAVARQIVEDAIDGAIG